MTRAEQVALLERRISESKLSVRRFARAVLLREERTIYRWLAGDSPIPERVVAWLETPEKHPWP